MYLLGKEDVDVRYHIESISLENDLNAFWEDDSILDKCELFAAVDDDVVGFLAIRKNESSIFVEMIETIMNGYGRKMIEELFKMYPDIKTIEGESLASAIPFWESLGAKFLFDSEEERLEALESYDCYLFSLDIGNMK